MRQYGYRELELANCLLSKGDKALVKLVSWKEDFCYGEHSEHIYKQWLFPSSLAEMWGTFCWILTVRIWWAPWGWSPQNDTSRDSPLSSKSTFSIQQFTKLSVNCSYNFMAVAASSLGELMEAGILCIHLPLQISGTSIFWWVLGESFIFSFFSFYLGRIEVMDFKLFTCHSWSWNFSFYF